MGASDADLLRRWGEGDRAAGTALFLRYYEPMYRFFATKIGVGIEDLVQDTFTACVAGRDRLRDDDGFRAYLYGAARNILYQAIRKVRAQGELLDLEETSVHDLGPSPSTVIAARAEQRLLLEALRRIPVDYQIAFELYYWEHLTAREMAKILEVSEAGVRSRLHRAKDELRRTMRRIAQSAEILESTMNNLQGWAEQLRAAVTRASTSGGGRPRPP